MNSQTFKQQKSKRKLAMITCYDYWSACLIANTDIDAVLVGDSVAMVMHGHQTPIPATTDLIALHTEAVSRGIGEQLLVADMPFLSTRKSLSDTMNNVEKLMHAGAQAIKIEGVCEPISHIVSAGIPVMGHLGLTPQSLHQLGGWKVQGKQINQASQLIEAAKTLENMGCFGIVLECIPTTLADTITQTLAIPTIGIGAGPETDGQILVLQDMLGLNPNFTPKFLKTYANGHNLVQQALKQYCDEVREKRFPTQEQCYTEAST